MPSIINMMKSGLLNEDINFPNFAKAHSTGEENTLARERRNYLSDPTNIEKMVSHLHSQFVPGDKAKKLAYGSRLAKVEDLMPSDDPRKGVGEKTLKEANFAIQQYPDRHPNEVIAAVYNKNLSDVAKDTYKYLDKAQSGFLGIPLTGRTLGKSLVGMPGYEEYLKEKEDYNKEHFSFDELSSPFSAMAMGLSFPALGSAAKHLAERGIGGKAVAALPKLVGTLGTTAAKFSRNPLVGIAGAALAAIPEFWAFEAAGQLVGKSDALKDKPWYVKLPVEFGVGGMAAGAVRKGIEGGIETLYKSRNIVKDTIDKVSEAPTVSNVAKFTGAKEEFNANVDQLEQMFKAASDGGFVPKVATMRERNIQQLEDMFKLMDDNISAKDSIKIVGQNDLIQSEIDAINKIGDKGYELIGKPLTPANPLVKMEERIANDVDLNNKLDSLVNPVTSKIDKTVKPKMTVAKGEEPDIAADVLASARPNVEKSSLFNEYTEKFKGMTYEDAKKEIELLRKKSKDKWAGEEIESAFEVKGREYVAEKRLLKQAEEEKKVVQDILGKVNEDDVKFADGIEKETKSIIGGEGLLDVNEENVDKISSSLSALESFTGESLSRDAWAAALKKEVDKVANARKIDLGQGSVGQKISPEKSKKTSSKTPPNKTTEPPLNKAEFDAKAMEIYNKYGGEGESYDNEMASLLKRMKGIAPLLIGGGALVALTDLMSPKDADAAVGTPVSRVVTTDFIKSIYNNLNFKDMAKEIMSKGYFATPYVEGSKNFGDKMYSISVVPSLSNVTRKAKSAWDFVRSPNVVWDELLNKTTADGRKIPTNPMMELAHRESAYMMNSMKGLQLVKDVMKDVPGGRDGAKEIELAMKKFIEKDDVFSTVAFHESNVKNLSDMVSGMEKKLAKASGMEKEALESDIFKLQSMIDISKKEVDSLSGAIQGYDKEWEVVARDLAKKYPSTRVFFALENRGMSKEDPWVLKYLTPEEKTAVGHLKIFEDKVAGYMKDVGGEVIENHVHYAAHPDKDFNKLAKQLEGFALSSDSLLPLAKFFHRSKGSVPLMPDVNYSMNHYIPDIFKRIEMIDFWKKGKAGGWDDFSKAVHKLGWKGPAEAMDRMRASFSPEQVTTMNDLARQFYALEAARLIGLNPAPGFKHLMKLESNWSNFGWKNTAKIIPDALNLYKGYIEESLSKLTGKPAEKDMIVEMYKSLTNAGNMSSIIRDLELAPEPKGWWGKMLEKANEYGGSIINNTERFDRAMSFVGSMNMAAKQGMTAEQALYGMYDTILKTNFLSGKQNPEWLRNPKVRMMMMFQGTPFKILEQRVLLASKAKGAFAEAAKETWKQLQNIKGDIKEGEKVFKFNLIKDALESQKDIYGIPYAYQLMRKLLTIGTVITGGAALFDADLTGHMLHLPIIKLHEGRADIAFNPAISAAIQTKPGEDEYWISEFFKKWMSSGPFPAAFVKGWRLTSNDIPVMYRDNKFRYLFGVPATKED